MSRDYESHVEKCEQAEIREEQQVLFISFQDFLKDIGLKVIDEVVRLGK